MENFKFFQNDKCEYYPCHKVEEGQQFNCLFCYCPLYALKDKCGGNYKYLENGIKDCSDCIIAHSEKGYEHIREHMKDVIELAKKVE